MENLTIRKATISDLKAVQGLNHKLCLKENQEFDSTINPDSPLSKEGEVYFTKRINGDNACVFVAEHDASVIGYLIGAIVEVEPYRYPTILAELENMYIDESFRDQGIGGKLYEEFEAWCKEKNVKRIRVIASEANVRALEFYRNRDLRGVDLTLEKSL